MSMSCGLTYPTLPPVRSVSVLGGCRLSVVFMKASDLGTRFRPIRTHRGAIDLYCFLCKKVAMPQPSTKLLETSFTLTVCCEPDLILLEQICPTMFGCRYHDS